VQEIVELRDGTKGSIETKHVNDLLDELVAHKRGPIREIMIGGMVVAKKEEGTIY
jgi:hypothetical protein